MIKKVLCNKRVNLVLLIAILNVVIVLANDSPGPAK